MEPVSAEELARLRKSHRALLAACEEWLDWLEFDGDDTADDFDHEHAIMRRMHAAIDAARKVTP